MDARTAFFEFDADGLRAWAVERGLPPFTGKQLLDWVYRRGVVDPAAMSDLSKAARELVAREMRFEQGEVRRHLLATDGTQKLLLAWPKVATPGEGAIASLPLAESDADERRTECVMIPAEDRRTACVSSQVGCPVGCRFCASGLGGLEGNLTRGRIVEQVWRLGRLEGVGRISNVVFMGMGEPLANFEAVAGAIRTLNADWGLGIGARRITVSTVGLPAAIRRLMTFELPVTLALSLHAPTDTLRREIIPWAEYSTIPELLEACHEWFRKTGREITLEYILLGGFNDAQEHAEELARLARSIRANVNLIRWNEVDGLPYARPSTEQVHAFQETLRVRGVNAHIRASRGRDIKAACGQLRHESRAGR